jgi:toxin FitB
LLEVEASLVVPAFSILEVFKWVLREQIEAQAIQAAAVMERGLVIDLDSGLAIAAAQFSHALRLPMADSIILTTVRAQQAKLYTLDADFMDLHDVELMQRL